MGVSNPQVDAQVYARDPEMNEKRPGFRAGGSRFSDVCCEMYATRQSFHLWRLGFSFGE